MTWDVREGECVALMRAMPAASVSAIVCDPPYDLLSVSRNGSRRINKDPDANPYSRTDRGNAMSGGGFMSMKWDGTGVAFDPATWAEALRVAKPGAHLLAFGGTRTFHRMTVAIEDAGWEIRDVISWLYASGFPKSLDVSKAMDKAAGASREVIGTRRDYSREESGDDRRWEGGKLNKSADFTAPTTEAAKQWEGWGTALKPAWEPIIVARKPLIGTVAANIAVHSVGALNIDGCRIGTAKDVPASPRRASQHTAFGDLSNATGDTSGFDANVGRWPANVMLDEDAAAMLDARTKTTKSGEYREERGTGGIWSPSSGVPAGPQYGDEGGPSRFFYVAKPSVAEREAGVGALPLKRAGVKNDSGRGYSESDPYRAIERGNFHPTVKPIALMRQLVRLVTPPDGVVLDPFCGSGTTGCAAVLEGFDFIGMEMMPEYAAIARARIAHYAAQPRQGGLF